MASYEWTLTFHVVSMPRPKSLSRSLSILRQVWKLRLRSPRKLEARGATLRERWSVMPSNEIILTKMACVQSERGEVICTRRVYSILTTMQSSNAVDAEPPMMSTMQSSPIKVMQVYSIITWPSSSCPSPCRFSQAHLRYHKYPDS